MLKIKNSHQSDLIPKFPDNFFNAIPGTAEPTIVARSFRLALKKDLISNLRKCSSAIGLDLRDYCEAIESLDIDSKWSPIVSVWLSAIKQALRSKHLDKIFDSLIFLRSTVDHKYDAKFRIDSALTESWEQTYIRRLRLSNVKINSGERTVIRPIITSTTAIIDPFQKSLELISKNDPYLAKEFHCYTTRLKIFNGIALVGSTSTDIMGAIYLRNPVKMTRPDLYLVEHLTHEVSHLHLHQLMIYDKMILNSDHERYPAPIRSDPRPMFGIFHATFVLSRMVRIFRKIADADIDAKNTLPKLEKQFWNGLRVIQENAKLTFRGRLILDSLIPCLKGLHQ